MNNKDILRKLSYVLMPALGMIFLLWYVRSAGYDVVYTDYIRLIAEYLPDVNDIKRLLVPDILTRIPATFLARFINYSSFGFSVTFDRLLAIGGIGLMAIVLSLYSYKYKVGYGWQAVVFIVLFSLNKWEILLNGTAWAHVVSFGLFFINYYLMDRLWRCETGSKEELMLFLMPVLLLLIAGEYIASYAVTMIFMSLLGILMGGAGGKTRGKERSLYKGILFMTALALILYMISRHFAVWEHSGATDKGILEVISEDPMYIPKFFFNTFAGAVIGQETVMNFFGNGEPLPETIVTVIGVIMFLSYLAALYVYVRSCLYEVTVFPAILVISGFGNHMLVTLGRWIFLDTAYALSSRYAGQFMIGLIGMALIFALYRTQKRELKGFGRTEKRAIGACTLAAVVLIIAGNCYTTYQEIGKAPYREANYAHMAEVIRNYEQYGTEELKKELEWTKDSDTLLKALKILKDNKLNVFRRP